MSLSLVSLLVLIAMLAISTYFALKYQTSNSLYRRRKNSKIFEIKLKKKSLKKSKKKV